MDRSLSVAGKVRRREGARVTDCPIDHKPRRSLAFGDHLHDLAHERSAGIATSINHQDITGPRDVQGLMDGQVVARSGPNRQSGADSRTFSSPLTKSLLRDHPTT